MNLHQENASSETEVQISAIEKGHALYISIREDYSALEKSVEEISSFYSRKWCLENGKGAPTDQVLNEYICAQTGQEDAWKRIVYMVRFRKIPGEKEIITKVWEPTHYTVGGVTVEAGAISVSTIIGDPSSGSVVVV